MPIKNNNSIVNFSKKNYTQIDIHLMSHIKVKK